MNKAFQYSSITSVTLLDCWTIAWVIILTWIFLETRYSLWQFLGSAVCVIGLALVLLSDSGVAGAGGVAFLSFFFPSGQKKKKKPSIRLMKILNVPLLSGGTRPVLGDVLVIAGTFFFAMSNVGEVIKVLFSL